MFVLNITVAATGVVHTDELRAAITDEDAPYDIYLNPTTSIRQIIDTEATFRELIVIH